MRTRRIRPISMAFIFNSFRQVQTSACLGNRQRLHGSDTERREAMLKAREFELRFLQGDREAFWNKGRHAS